MNETSIDVVVIARTCHEVNRVIQIFQADPTIPVSPPWEETDQETKESVIDGVVKRITLGLTPAESHANWMDFKLDAGWKLGPVKDLDKKEHPLLIPYEDLPADQKLKDHTFMAVVNSLADHARIM